MSKIQKALGRLRSDRRNSDSESAATSGMGRERAGDVRGKVFRRRPDTEPNIVDDELMPDFLIRVSSDALSDHGLQLSGINNELLAQQYRRIKRPLLNFAFGELGLGARNSNVVMVASALPQSGKTFCSYNLALSIARERDIGAVLVDADVLKPNISRAFGIADRIGLIDYLLQRDITLEEILVGTDLHDVVLVPAGQQHEEATELLASRRMEQFIAELSQRFPLRAVVVDTPPLLLTNEAHVLAEHMGQIVFIIEFYCWRVTFRSIKQNNEFLQGKWRGHPRFFTYFDFWFNPYFPCVI